LKAGFSITEPVSLLSGEGLGAGIYNQYSLAKQLPHPSVAKRWLKSRPINQKRRINST
jgi:hypothetical protein